MLAFHLGQSVDYIYMFIMQFFQIFLQRVYLRLAYFFLDHIFLPKGLCRKTLHLGSSQGFADWLTSCNLKGSYNWPGLCFNHTGS